VLFETETHQGLPMFIAAIIINMVCSETMCWLEKSEETEGENTEDEIKVRPAQNSGWRSVVVPILMLGTAGTLVCGWYFPFLKLTAKFLKTMEYSVFNLVLAMG